MPPFDPRATGAAAKPRNVLTRPVWGVKPLEPALKGPARRWLRRAQVLHPLRRVPAPAAPQQVGTGLLRRFAPLQLLADGHTSVQMAVGPSCPQPPLQRPRIPL